MPRKKSTNSKARDGEVPIRERSATAGATVSPRYSRQTRDEANETLEARRKEVPRGEVTDEEKRLRNLVDIYPDVSSSESSTRSGLRRSTRSREGSPKGVDSFERRKCQWKTEETVLSRRRAVFRVPSLFSSPPSPVPLSSLSTRSANSNSDEGSPATGSSQSLLSPYSNPSSPNTYRIMPSFEATYSNFYSPRSVGHEGLDRVATPSAYGAQGSTPLPQGARSSDVPKRVPHRCASDKRMLAAILTATSYLLWVPYTAAALYMAYCDSFMLEDESLDPNGGVPASAAMPNAFGASYSTTTGSGVGSSFSAFLQGGLPPLRKDYPYFYYYIFREGFDVLHFLWLAIPITLFSALAVSCTTWLARVPKDQIPVYLVILAWSLGFLSFIFWGTDAVHQSKAESFLTTSTSPSSLSAVVKRILEERQHGTPGWFSSTRLPAPFMTKSAQFATPVFPAPHAQVPGTTTTTAGTCAMDRAIPLAECTPGTADRIPLRLVDTPEVDPLDFVSLLVHYGLISVQDFRLPSPPAWLWLMVSLATGLLSGVLCKVRDRLDQKRRKAKRNRSLFAHRGGVWYGKRQSLPELSNPSLTSVPFTMESVPGLSPSVWSKTEPPAKTNDDVLPTSGRGNVESTPRGGADFTASFSGRGTPPPVSSTAAAVELGAIRTSTDTGMRSTSPTTEGAGAPVLSTPFHSEGTTTFPPTGSLPTAVGSGSALEELNQYGSPSSWTPVTTGNGNFGYHPLLPRPPSWPGVPHSGVSSGQYASRPPPPPRHCVVIRPRMPSGPVKSRAMSLHMSLIMPFCAGQWFSLMIRYGWQGFLTQNLVVTVTLGFIGYSTICFQLLRKHLRRSMREVVDRSTVLRHHRVAGVVDNGLAIAQEEEIVVEMVVEHVDYIHFFYRLFATKMGLVVVALMGLHFYVTSWMWAMVQTLYTLNALVSGAGILVELLIYEMV